jgi:stage II sporulation protein D
VLTPGRPPYRRTVRWRMLLVLLALALVPAPAARAAVPVLVVDGRGHGHGVGMAQDGAYWMGRAGADLGGILGHFYPGAGLARAGGHVRVVVLVDDDASEVLTFPGGGELRSPRDGPQAPGFPVQVPPGGAVRVRHDGAYRVEGDGEVSARAALQPVPLPTTSTTTVPPPPESPTTTAPPAAPTTTAPAQPEPEPGAPPSEPQPGQTSDHPVWAFPTGDGTVGVPARAAVYRGAIEATAAAGALRLVNELDVEQYLRGMGEVRDPSWPAAALQAQAVVARTYALRAMAANGEICDTQRCQVYLGQQAEYGAMDRAVAATAAQVLVHNGRLASSVYSASAGGVSATPQEGFDQPDAAHPYLVARTYDTPDPRPYEVRIGLADLGRRLGYPGDLTAVRVSTTGPSGRALVVELDGSGGVREIEPLALGRAAGARSTLWTLRVEQADVAPEPPAPTDDLLPIQAPPDDLGRVVAEQRGERRRVDVANVVVSVPDPEDGPEEPAPDWAQPLLLAVVALAGAYGLWTLTRGRRSPS